MPTGYTDDVGKGKVRDFRTFALRCARQFGACVMQRDEPLDSPPRLVEPSDYHDKALASATAELARLQAMTVEQAAREADAEWAVHTEQQTKRRQKRMETESNYRAMLREVQAWNPPTPDHTALKAFMVEQLEQSIDFDCHDYADGAEHLSGEEWLTAKRGKAAKDIGYHRAERAKEIERTNERNAWITELYASLAPTRSSGAER